MGRILVCAKTAQYIGLVLPSQALLAAVMSWGG